MLLVGCFQWLYRKFLAWKFFPNTEPNISTKNHDFRKESKNFCRGRGRVKIHEDKKWAPKGIISLRLFSFEISQRYLTVEGFKTVSTSYQMSFQQGNLFIAKITRIDFSKQCKPTQCTISSTKLRVFFVQTVSLSFVILETRIYFFKHSNIPYNRR